MVIISIKLLYGSQKVNKLMQIIADKDISVLLCTCAVTRFYICITIHEVLLTVV